MNVLYQYDDVCRRPSSKVDVVVGYRQSFDDQNHTLDLTYGVLERDLIPQILLRKTE